MAKEDRREYFKEYYRQNKDKRREYFKEYVEFVHDNGCDVYLLEYTKSASLIDKIDSYCKEKGFKYYASKTLELLAS